MKQRGFTLLELSIAITIMAIAMVTGLYLDQAHLRERRGAAQADLLVAASSALDQYMTTYYSQIVSAGTGGTVTGVSNSLAPTFAELKALGLLTATLSATPLYGGNYQFAVTCNPAPCVSSSKLSGLTWITNPLSNPRHPGNPDGMALASAGQEGGGDIGWAEVNTPSVITWAGGTTSPNPAGAVAGILAMRSGNASAQFNQFLRRDGSLPMTGDLDFGGKLVKNLGAQTIGAPCSIPGAVGSGPGGEVVSCQSTLWKTQGSAYWQDPVATFAALNSSYPCTAALAYQTRIVKTPTTGTGPRAYTCNGASWQALAIDDAGNLTVPGLLTAAKLNLQKTVNEGDPCNPAVDGNFAVTSTGLALSCQSSAWKIPGYSPPTCNSNGCFQRQSSGMIVQWASVRIPASGGYGESACFNYGTPFNNAWSITANVTSVPFSGNGFTPGVQVFNQSNVGFCATVDDGGIFTTSANGLRMNRDAWIYYTAIGN